MPRTLEGLRVFQPGFARPPPSSPRAVVRATIVASRPPPTVDGAPYPEDMDVSRHHLLLPCHLHATRSVLPSPSSVWHQIRSRVVRYGETECSLSRPGAREDGLRRLNHNRNDECGLVSARTGAV
uniref:Uncharacterized protein n=1 Tax=Leersia perrieri TaxID=77586 RepID=A0A0D9XXK0_9ORYZ